MKKLIILLLAGVFIGGCDAQRNIVTRSWVKEGISPENLRKDYEECSFGRFAKDGITTEKYQEDINFCKTEVIIRENRIKTAAGSTFVIPFVELGFLIAKDSLVSRSDNYYRRCMEAKGYFLLANPPQCMEEKGYEWK